jgi:epoxyqueuosine reductase QueG
MKTVQEIFDRLQEKKKQVSVVRRKYKEELAATSEYQRINDEMAKLREKKKKYEASVKQQSGANFARIDELALTIKQDAQMLSDVALTTVLKGDRIEVKDSERQVEYEPVFTVRFRKMK